MSATPAKRFPGHYEAQEPALRTCSISTSNLPFKAISELAAFIAAHGLLQSLVALKDALPLLPPFGTELKEPRPTICVRIARLLGRGDQMDDCGRPDRLACSHS